MSRYPVRPPIQPRPSFPPQVILPPIGRIDPQIAQGLFSVINTGQIGDIKEYLDHNHMHANVTDDKGRSPVHVAILIDKDLTDELSLLSIIKLLVSYQSPIHTPDFQNNWQIHLAVDKQYLEIVKYLVSKGSTLDTMDASGNTCLQLAITGASTDCPVENANKPQELITYASTNADSSLKLNALVVEIVDKMKHNTNVQNDLTNLTSAIRELPDIDESVKTAITNKLTSRVENVSVDTVYQDIYRTMNDRYGMFLNGQTIFK